MELPAFILLCAWTGVVVWDVRKAVIFLPALFPLYLLKFQVGFVPFNVIEVMVYLAVVMYVGKILREKFFGNAGVKLWRKFTGLFVKCKEDRCVFVHLRERFFRFIFPVIGLVLGSLGGLYISYLNGDIMLALGIFKGWIVMPILYAVLVITVLRSVDDKKKTLYFYMLSVLVLSLWALYQVVSKNYITIDGRASGPFESANYLALYVAPAVILSGLFLWQKLEEFFWGEEGDAGWVKKTFVKVKGLFRKREEKDVRRFLEIFEIGVFVVSSLALLLSRSYGGILGVLVAGGVYAVYELFYSDFRLKYGGFWKKTAVFAAVLLMLAMATVAQMGTSKFDDFLVFDRQSSSSVRMQVWTVSGKLIEENPFLGIGLGGFESVYEQRAGEILGVEPYEATMLHPHNLIISTWLNAGMIGAIAIGWLVVVMFWRIRKKEFTYEERRFIAVVLSMFIVVCIHGVVDQSFWKNDLALLWWMIVGTVI